MTVMVIIRYISQVEFSHTHINTMLDITMFCFVFFTDKGQRERLLDSALWLTSESRNSNVLLLLQYIQAAFAVRFFTVLVDIMAWQPLADCPILSILYTETEYYTHFCSLCSLCPRGLTSHLGWFFYQPGLSTGCISDTG